MLDTLVDLAQLKIKQGTYRTGSTDALGDPQLLPFAKMRRRQMSQMMVALDHAQSKTRLPAGSYQISQKLDGEFTILVYRDGQVVSLNPYGTARAGAPFHEEFGQLLAKAGIKRAVIGGELYVKTAEKSRTRVHDVCRVARAPKSQADVDSLYYAVFALYDVDGVDLSMSPVEQTKRIHQIFAGGGHVHPIETVTGSEADVQKRFDEWVLRDGGEGLIVRSDKFGWFKIKPRHSIDLAVIGFSEGTEDRAGMLHSLLIAVVRDDGSFHVVGRTGGGFSDEERVSMLADLSKRTADSDYIEVNSDRVAYKMIKPGLVAEISCLDIISETSEGEPIPRMVISYNPVKNSWSNVNRASLASIISPQFERFRDDKKAGVEDTGVNQLSRIVEVPEASVPVSSLKLPKSEVLRRAVATKELKGKTMVRKLLLWKTNKDKSEQSEFPAYVLLLTDFSPNRKTPLEREIRVSADLEQIEGYWKTWTAENFVKGWVLA
jgi:ATP-dependent DNA ligase